MSLLDEARAKTLRNTQVCGVLALVNRLDPPKQAQLYEALASDVPATALARALAGPEWGLEMSDQIISRHRRGNCSCP